MEKVTKVALIQTRIEPNLGANLEKMECRIRDAAKQGAKLICLPELFLSPYFCQVESDEYFDWAEPIPGPTTTRLAEIARSTQTVLIVPLFEKRAPGLYHNSVAVLRASGELAGVYRKMHIPDDPAYYEKFYFTPGDLGFQVFDTEVGKVGTLICWDQWFPEAARLTALKGAEILVYPTAIGWHPGEKLSQGKAQLDAWKTVQRGHAIANGLYVAAINRIGHELPTKVSGDGIQFWGHSFVADPQGAVMVEGSEDEEQILMTEVDRVHLEQIRRNWPFYRDRRIETYGPITQRFIDPA